MQIFEFHFNPKTGEEKNLDSFIYEPETNLEKKMGNLYLLGEIGNISSGNSRLLDSIAQIFKKNYYSLSIKSSEKSLSYASKRVNEYLSDEVKKENVGWLGNLNFGILSVTGMDLNFTKTGDLKILLMRAGQIVDIGKNLENQEIDPYPLKVFFNVVSGKLAEDDRLVVLTKDVYDSFKEKGVLDNLAKEDELDSNKLKEIIPESKIAGACLIIISNDKKEKPKKEQIVGKAPKTKLLPKMPKIKIPEFKLPSFKINLNRKDKENMGKLRVPIKTTGPMIEKFKNKINFKRGVLPVVGLIIVLLIGFYFFKGVPNKQEKEIRVSIEEIQAKIDEAQNLLVFNNEKDANRIFQEAWEKVLTIQDLPEALPLKNTIEAGLNKINKIEVVIEPEVATKVDGELLNKMKALSSLSDTGLIFQEPNLLYVLKNKIWVEKEIDPPSFKFNPTIFASYFSNLYLLDKDNCEVAKYSHLSGLSWGAGKKWLQDKDHCSTPKSITVDGSLYILNSDNSISIHHSGKYQKTITVDTFPKINNITEIKTKVNIPYLFLLEPLNNRLIVIDKDGKLFKQFQSDKFSNLIDFDISPSGKYIYLLDNTNIYELSI